MKTIVKLRSVQAAFAGVRRLPFSGGRRTGYWQLLEPIYCRGDYPRADGRRIRPPVARIGTEVSSAFLRAVGVVPQPVTYRPATYPPNKRLRRIHHRRKK
jgi:hypothetical protein